MVHPHLSAPAPDEFEVTIFGPGFGESIVIHSGDHEWVIVDSCIHSDSGRPAALWYLDEIGISREAVKVILASHWHDDHIRGMSKVVASYPKARFYCSAALTRSEFQRVAELFNKNISAAGSGLHEIQQTFSVLKARGDIPEYVLHDMVLWSPPGKTLPAVLTALSPSNAEFHRFLNMMARVWADTENRTMFRYPSPTPNELSVAAWLKMAAVKVLLGADLEEHGAPDRGWTAVLASSRRPSGRAGLFKIAHHGSLTGHHDGVWSSMLEDQPLAVLTPWNRGRKLPTADDIARIVAFTSNGYTTCRRGQKKLKTGISAVDRTIREMAVDLRVAEPTTGFVRARLSDPSKGWNVVCSPDAGLLAYSGNEIPA